ncbi:MAG: hypothetical protein JSU79_00455 [Dehalococcoidales bacterium]|nr:MAG: hypothetical protein JSU79_00455 [Dehalococcoidales bacterium]
MPYIAKLEKAGIPTVLIDLEDQHEMVKQESMAAGVPNVRYIPASRTLPGPEDVEVWTKDMLAMLTDPLTEKEKEEGMHTPSQDRILFEGTLDEAQEFYQQTRIVPEPLNAPISIYTDGLPIIVPTEERVAEMLKGTSHKPDEIITYKSERRGRFDRIQEHSDVVRFQPRLFTATVEKVAINAVMAGCKPEHLPVVLAIAESGVPSGTTVFNNQWMCLSGPIVKEIGMNSGLGMMGPGNPASMAIGRAYQLMAVNLGGAIPGINRMSSIGTPINRVGLAFAECADKLPPGWKGLNEEFGFKKDESVIMVMGTEGGLNGAQFSPGGYRALQKSGHGGMARKLGVKGIPGPHNWLDWIVPDIWTGEREGGRIFVMVHEMAYDLYRLGFKSKKEVLEYVWKKSFEPLKRYRDRSWVDLTTNGWLGNESLSGKPWKELPDDYMVPAGGSKPEESCIIVCGSDEEICYEITGSIRGMWGSDPVYSIDAWR